MEGGVHGLFYLIIPECIETEEPTRKDSLGRVSNQVPPKFGPRDSLTAEVRNLGLREKPEIYITVNKIITARGPNLVLQAGQGSIGNRPQKLNRVYPVTAGKTPGFLSISVRHRITSCGSLPACRNFVLFSTAISDHAFNDPLA